MEKETIMRSVLRWGLAPLAACVLALGLVGPGRAADEPHSGHGKGADQMVYDLLLDITNEGVDLYNSGDYRGCYYLWVGSLKTLRPALEHHEEWQKVIDAALAEAQRTPQMPDRDWALRRAMDKIRDEIHPPKKGETAAETPAPRGTGARSTTGEPPKATTLWDRLGGEKGVSKVIDDFTTVAASDRRVDFTRGGKYKPTPEDIAKFKKEMVAWVSSKTGGPLKYLGENMKKAHEGMKITDAQFDALVEDLGDVLAKNGVKGEDEHAILQAVEATRKDIVQKKTGEEPEEKKPEEKKDGEKKDGEVKSGEKKSGEDKASEGKKANATVMGHVTYRGQPVPGTITLTAKDGTVVSGAIAEDGTYAVEGVKPGTYTATVKASGDKAKAVSLPEKYGDPLKSGLTYEVKEGRQTLDVDLRP
jgi:hemoglobin